MTAGSDQISETYSKSAQGLVKRKFLRYQQVGALPLEQFVVLLLDNEVNITSFHTWHFI